jgi:hypothetical protein
MSTPTRDRLPVLIPLGMVAVLAAVYIGTTLARNSAQPPQAAPSPTPSPVSSTAPTVSPSPAASPIDKTINSGAAVRIKSSGSGCQPAFDSPSPDRLQTVCFLDGQIFEATGKQQDGLTELQSGENRFWMVTTALEPSPEQPEKLLPPEPQANWN